MNYNLKKELMDYLKRNPSNDENYNALVSAMEYELRSADLEGHTIAVEDLETIDGEELRNFLGKTSDEELTIEDAISCANAMDEYLQGEFYENLNYAIGY